MNLDSLFPTFPREEIFERVKDYWDLSGSLPIPKFDRECSVCHSDEILTRQWRFHNRTSTTGTSYGFRCDVSFKCTKCSFVWVHGVVVPKEMFDKAVPKLIHWREAKKILEEDLKRK